MPTKKAENHNGKNGHQPTNPSMLGTRYEGAPPVLPITPVFEEAPQQLADYVIHLEKLVQSMMSTENMRLRTNLNKRMVIHIGRAETLESFAKDYGFKETEKRARQFKEYILQISVGVDNLGMKNLIAGLQAARPTPSTFMDGTGQGFFERTKNRILGRR